LASDEVDLHGLFVKEAIEQTGKALQAALKRKDKKLRLIVGKVSNIFSWLYLADCVFLL